MRVERHGHPRTRCVSSLPLIWRLRAGAACLFIPPLVNMTSFGRLARWLGASNRSRSADIDDQAAAEWVTDFLHRLPDSWYPTCLRRSAVLYYLLRRSGRPVQMWLGVQRNGDGSLDAHAWLVSDGQPYLEPGTSDPALYTVIARFPEDGLARTA
jgi:hypothetical protein